MRKLEEYLEDTNVPLLIRMQALRQASLSNAKFLDLGAKILKNATGEEKRIYAEPLRIFASLLEKRGLAKADH
jgi:hypothetical protein